MLGREEPSVIAVTSSSSASKEEMQDWSRAFLVQRDRTELLGCFYRHRSRRFPNVAVQHPAIHPGEQPGCLFVFMPQLEER